MAKKLQQKEFIKFEKAFNRIRRENRAEREEAVGILTPGLLKKHIKSGQDLVLQYGRQGKTRTYDLAELKEFARHIKRQEGRKKKEVAGVPVIKLEKLSWMADRKKMRQIRNATLYRFMNNILHFQVSSSGGTAKTHYQVKVRLEQWYNAMTSTLPWQRIAREVSAGRISFDCTCGRHQYWFRYLATIGNFALIPKEHAFPKIRNPRLGGACCKHVLKVLQQLKSPSVHVLVAREMERQSESAGYIDKGKSKFLTPKELDKAKRARGTGKESAAARKAYKEFVQARKSFSRKQKEKIVADQIDALKARDVSRKKFIKKQKIKIEQQELDIVSKKIENSILKGLFMEKKERKDVVADVAKEYDMEPIEIDIIAKDLKL